MKRISFFEDITKYFLPAYYARSYGWEPRFPSVVTALFRFMLRHPVFVWILSLAGMMIRGIVLQQPFLQVVLLGLLTGSLAAVGAYLGMLVLMLFESLARIVACQILYQELPRGAENVVDSYITYVIRGK